MNPLKALGELGQSIWLDNMQRSLVTTGELARLIRGGRAEGADLQPHHLPEGGGGQLRLRRRLRPVGREGRQRRAGLRRPVGPRHPRRGGRLPTGLGGHPAPRRLLLAGGGAPPSPTTPQGTMSEARRLWKALASPNVMIKIPGTVEGVPAIEQAISEGININVTLLFGQEAYAAVAEAFLRGLEKRVARGRGHLADRVGGQLLRQPDRHPGGEDHRRPEEGGGHPRAAGALRRAGRSGGDRQRQAGVPHTTSRSSPRPGGRPWPTRERRPSACCGPAPAPRTPPTPTSTTWRRSSARTRWTPCLRRPWSPTATTESRSATLDQGLDKADAVMRKLEQSGISMKAVTDQLVEEGVKSFGDSFERAALRGGVASWVEARGERHRPAAAPRSSRRRSTRTLADWDQGKKMQRLWERDADAVDRRRTRRSGSAGWR